MGIMDLIIILCKIDSYISLMKKVICKIFLDHIAFIPATDNKIIKTPIGIDFHDVPEDRFTPISIIGLGLRSVSSLILVPKPPAE